MADDFGLRIGLEGEKEFKDALRDINQSFKLLGSEMKLATSEFDKNDRSVSALTSRNTVLNKEIEAQRQKVETLKAALQNSAESFGENDKRTQAWQIQLNNATAELNGMEREVSQNEKAIAEMSGAEGDAAQNADKLGGELGKAGSAAAESGGKFDGLVDALKKTGQVVAGVVTAVGAAATAVGVGMFKMADGAASAGKEVNNTSQKLGLSREGFQEWDYILKKSGASIDVMGTGMKTLQKTMGGLTEDGDSASKAFAAVGLSFDEIKGKSPEEALNLTVRALQDLPAGADRTAAALKLFGKGAMELQPLLNKTSEETDALRQRAHDMGLVLSDEQVNNSVKFKSAMGKITDTLNGMKLQIASSIVPAFADGLSAFLDFANGVEGGEEKMKSAVDNITAAISTTVPQFVEQGSQMISAIVSGLSAALPGIADAIGAALPLVVTTITSMLPPIINTIMQAVPSVVNALLSALPAIANAGVQIIIALVNGLSGMLPQLIPIAVGAVMSIVEGLLQNLNPLLEAALQLILALVDGILAAIPQLIAALPAIITAILDFLVGSIPQIISAGVQLLVSLVTALPQIIATIIAVIPQIIASIVTAVIQMIPQIIQAGIDLLVSLIRALPQIIQSIVEAIPIIINGIITAILGNIDKIIMAGVQLMISLVTALPTIIVEVVKAVPQIIMALVNGFTNSVGKIVEVGGNLIKGLWQGILNVKDWIMDKIRGFMNSIVDGIKSFFGIHSPSTLFAGIGGNMAQGLGVGFEASMAQVSRNMQNAIPTSFDTNVNANIAADMVNGMAGVFSGVLGGGNSQPITLQVLLDGKTIAQTIFDPLREVGRQRGVAFG